MDTTFLIGGEAGQGVESGGAGFVQALMRAGLHVLGVPSYYSRIRGGHNYFTIRASDQPVYAVKDEIEVLLALNAETVTEHVGEIVAGGAIIVDENVKLDDGLLDGHDVHLMAMPLAEIAEKHGNPVMVNTATLAVAAAVVGLDLEPVLSVIEGNFSKKGNKVVEANRLVAQEAYDLARERYGDTLTFRLAAQIDQPQRIALGTNHAFAMGALMAGVKFLGGYPMTPASSVMEYLAGHAAKWGLVVKHAEDEIAAVNMCIGAAHTGVRALTSTSGGGFDLMTEGMSLAAMTETPLVIYLAQRPGPATGLATRTNQSDLLLALFSSHGEFPRVVLAPHTPEEAFEAAFRAFNLAEKYQCTVLVLSDQYDASSVGTCDRAAFDMQAHEIDRGKVLSAEALAAIEDYQRYAITEDGVSPRAYPGVRANAVYLATGNEHLENGHITEDPEVTVAMLDKRMRKLDGLRAEMRPPLQYGPDAAEITLVSWGSSYGPVREAMNILNAAEPGSANMVQLVDLWPFRADLAHDALDGRKRLVLVEGNATSQLGALLRMEAGISIDETILRYDGRPFTAQYIVDRLEVE